MLPLESLAICGSKDVPPSLEMFEGVEKLAPPSAERLKKISELPRELSTQTRLILPPASTAICSACVLPEEFEMFFGGEKTTWAWAATADTAKSTTKPARHFAERRKTFLSRDRFIGLTP